MISTINQFFNQCQAYGNIPDYIGPLFLFLFILLFLIIATLIFGFSNLKLPYILLISGILSSIIIGIGDICIQHHYDEQAQTVKVKATKTIDEINQKYPYVSILNQQDKLHTTVAFTKKPITNEQINQSKNHEIKADDNCLIMTFNATNIDYNNVTYPYSYTFKSQPALNTQSTKDYLTSLFNKCHY